MLALLLFFVFFLTSNTGWAAITCTGQSFPFNTPSNPQAQNYTVPSVSNGITIIHVGTRLSTRTVTSSTIGGGATTQIGSRVTSTDTANEVFYSLNVSSGVQSISVGWDGTPSSYVLTAVTCEGVAQSSPVAVTNSASGSGSGITVNCAGTSASQLVLDFATSDGPTGLTVGGGQTNIDNDIADALLTAGVSSEPGGGTVTMSQTGGGGDWTTICAALNAATAGRRAIAPLVSQ